MPGNDMVALAMHRGPIGNLALPTYTFAKGEAGLVVVDGAIYFVRSTVDSGELVIDEINVEELLDWLLPEPDEEDDHEG